MSATSAPRTLATLAHWLATPLHPRQYLELVNPLWAGSLCGRIEEIRRETRDAVSLVIRPNHLWQGARAGQYIRLGVDIDGVRHWRCYSISSAIHGRKDCFTVTVGRLDGGRVSTHIQENLRIGDVLALDQASGDFVLPEGELPKLLFISAGTGITPMMGMLRTLEAEGRAVDVVHMHYAPDEASCLFVDALDGLNGRGDVRIERFYTRRGADHFNAGQLVNTCSDWAERIVYVCGPRGLMESVREHWISAGLGERLHEESFLPVRAPVTDGQGGEVRFWNAGQSTQGAGDKPLLEVAEEAGLLPKHGCRMGICQGCLVTLREGQVRDLTTGEVFGEPGETVRICVCAAAGDVTLDI